MSLDDLLCSLRQSYDSINLTLSELQPPVTPLGSDFEFILPGGDQVHVIPSAQFQRHPSYSLQRIVMRIPCFALDVPDERNRNVAHTALCLQAPTLWARLIGAVQPFEILLFVRRHRARLYLRGNRNPQPTVRKILAKSNMIFLLSPEQEIQVNRLRLFSGNPVRGAGFWTKLWSWLTGN